MATSPTQIRIDTTIKEEANILFSRLGLDMSSAVNIFLRQCLLRGGLPFSVEVPKYNEETLAAMEDAFQEIQIFKGIQALMSFLKHWMKNNV